MKNLFTLLVFFIAIPINIFAQSFNWARQAGYHSSEMSHSVSTDGNGNCYVTGEMSPQTEFNSTVFGGTFVEGFIAKYDYNGNLIWVNNITGPDTESPYDISTDVAGNSVVTGMFNQTATFDNITITSSGSYEIFLAKYDALGNVLWAKKAGGTSGDNGAGVLMDDNGNIYLCGAFTQTATFDNISLTSQGSLDIFIAKYDAAGNALWAVNAGGAGSDYANEITVKHDKLYITGAFQQTANFGSTTLTSAGHYDIFLASYDTSGNPLWSVSAGSNSWTVEAGSSVAADISGNVYICGSFGGSTLFGNTSITSTGGGDYLDSFIASYSASGNFNWVKYGGGISADGANDITVDNNGLVYVGGTYNGNATFDNLQVSPLGQNSDIFIACYNSSGIIQWLKNAGGGQGSDAAMGVCYDNIGGLFVSGFFNRTAYFDNVNLPLQYLERNIFTAHMSLPGSTTAIAESLNDEIYLKCEPNPAGFQTLLKFKLNKSEEFILNIYNVSGQLIEKQIFKNPESSESTMSVNLIDWPQGIYFVQITDGSIQLNQKLIISK